MPESECIVYWAKNGSIAKIEIAIDGNAEIETTSEEGIKYQIIM